MSPAPANTEAPVQVTLERRSVTGTSLGQVTLDPSIFSVPDNPSLLHQVITAQLAARRSGTQSTKTRSEVRGGSAKPYRQKGTGNARQGSIRAPHYSGGGVALGPKPRSYEQRTPRKMVQAALRVALSDRARTGRLRLVDQWSFDAPKTKQAIAALAALECTGKVVVVLERSETDGLKSFKNLPNVATLPADQLNAYDVLNADVLVFSDATLPGATTPIETTPKKRTAKAAATPVAKDAVDDGAGIDEADTGSDETPASSEGDES